MVEIFRQRKFWLATLASHKRSINGIMTSLILCYYVMDCYLTSYFTGKHNYNFCKIERNVHSYISWFNRLMALTENFFCRKVHIFNFKSFSNSPRAQVTSQSFQLTPTSSGIFILLGFTIYGILFIFYFFLIKKKIFPG